MTVMNSLMNEFFFFFYYYYYYFQLTVFKISSGFGRSPAAKCISVHFS